MSVRAFLRALLLSASVACWTETPVAAVEPQDSLGFQLLMAERWVPSEATTVTVRVSNAFVDPIDMDGARLEVPPELRCGTRAESVELTFEEPITLNPGATHDLGFPIPEGGACLSLGMLKPASSRATIQVSFFHPVQEEITDQEELVLAWAAPITFVIVGAALGVLAAYVFLLLAVKTERLKMLRTKAPLLTEVAFGVLGVALIVILARVLQQGEGPEFLRTFQAESFGHGLMLGLLYQSSTGVLIRWMTGSREAAKQGGKEDSNKDDAQAPARVDSLPERSVT
jgi:hypothetical protein